MCDGYNIMNRTLGEIINEGQEQAVIEAITEHYEQSWSWAHKNLNILRTCIDAIMVVNRNRNKAITRLCEEAKAQTDSLPWMERRADNAAD